ncbi:MAG: hypothetical protein IJJ69_09360 [Oscillospiraceae bacterium]|nr:hypothetical protein [Oscillospiraceae bacterium]
MKSALKSMNEKKVTSNETDTPVTMENDLPLLDRNQYKTIKKMDRASLESLINDIYESGRKKGAEEAVSAASDSENSSDNSVSNQENSCVEDTADNHHTLDLRVLEKKICSVKGIGAKRTEEVMIIIEQWLKLE